MWDGEGDRVLGLCAVLCCAVLLTTIQILINDIYTCHLHCSKGVILLNGAKIEPLDTKQVDHQNGFSIKPSNKGRTYILVANSEKERALWIKYLTLKASIETTIVPQTPSFSHHEIHSGDESSDRESLSDHGYENDSNDSNDNIVSPPKIASIVPANCIKYGFLLKRGEVNKEWKKRYFVLIPGHLKYYQLGKENSPQARGSITLANATVCIYDPKTYGRHHCFGLFEKNSNRAYVLKAATDGERDDWLRHLSSQAATHTVIEKELKPIPLSELSPHVAQLLQKVFTAVCWVYDYYFYCHGLLLTYLSFISIGSLIHSFHLVMV